MADATLQSLDNSVRVLRTTVAGLNTRIDDIIKMFESYASIADLNAKFNELDSKISDLNSALSLMGEKLKNILLPDDTRFYLSASEITDFRNNFRQLRAMMTDVEKSRQSMIKLSSRFNLTNSQI